MKRFIVVFAFIFCLIFSKANTTYFPDNANAWVVGDDVKARLYSVEIRSGQTCVTIELVPLKNMKRLNFWTSTNTIIQVANGKIELPILGFLRTENGETYYHTDPFSGGVGLE